MAEGRTKSGISKIN